MRATPAAYRAAARIREHLLKKQLGAEMQDLVQQIAPFIDAELVGAGEVVGAAVARTETYLEILHTPGSSFKCSSVQKAETQLAELRALHTNLTPRNYE